MQNSSGEHHQPQQQAPYFLGAPCDPNLLAFAQSTLLGYPAKNLYAQAFPTPQLPSLVLPPAMLSTMHSIPPRNRLPSLTAAIPEMDKLLVEEPIEAGSAPYRRPSNKSSAVPVTDDSMNFWMRSSSSNFRRHSAQWETMTDDEREMIQRQKRKEEAFKTALCDAFKRVGSCPYGESCRFAHGENELRMPSQPRGKAHPKYKTQLCDKFSTYGQCPYGPRCQFIHKLKKGLPLLEYNRALGQGRISPARDDEIINPDESQSDDISGNNLTHNISHRRCSGNFLDTSDSGYSGGGRRRLHQQFEQLEEQPCLKSSTGKIVYPPMQVVNIEMATGQKKPSSSVSETPLQNQSRHQNQLSQNGQMSPLIDQADYEASMASGKMFGKPVSGMSISNSKSEDLQENIRTYGAMIRANEDHVERNQTRGASRKERANIPPKRELSLIREEDTLLVDGSPLQSSTAGAPAAATQNTFSVEDAPWYLKIFGKMTIINEESAGDNDDDSRLQAHNDADYSK